MEKRNVQSLIDQTFNEVDQIYNYWNPYSEISLLNKLKKHEKKKISQKLKQFLEITEKIVLLTEGRFDPTIRPLQILWKNYLEKGIAPPQEEIAALLPAVGWDKIHFSDGFFRKDHDATSLDLGGIAKGYCVDLIAEKFSDAGFHDFYIEWGGEIYTNGKHPDDRPWRVFISKLGDPDPENAVAIVELHDEAIATSGDYHQNWMAGNVKYTHIIDPKTGAPLISDPEAIASASVVAPTCTLADGLATALMMPSTNMEWIEKLQTEFPSIRFWRHRRIEAK